MCDTNDNNKMKNVYGKITKIKICSHCLDTQRIRVMKWITNVSKTTLLSNKYKLYSTILLFVIVKNFRLPQR